MKKKIIIIAEAGVNHNGKLSLGKRLIDTAKKSGADYIKFQMFKTDSHIRKNTPLANYQSLNLKKKTNQYNMVKKLQLEEKDIEKLFIYSKKKKIKFLASCFDLKSLKIYLKLKPKIIKIPSGEITNLPLIEEIGKKNKKIFLSTGMATLSEIKKCLNVLTRNGTKKKNIYILQCTTDYPCKIYDVNLNFLNELKKIFGTNIGFSDHTITYDAAIIAASLGAKIIEKHITTNKSLKGPDHKASFNPQEFKIYVNKLRDVEKILGSKKKKITKYEKKNLFFVRKSIVATKNINIGDKFSKNNLGTKRPYDGISPMKMNLFIGKISKKNFKVDETIS